MAFEKMESMNSVERMEQALINDVFHGGVEELQAVVKEAWEQAEKDYKDTEKQDREMFYKSNTFYAQIFGSRDYAYSVMKDHYGIWKKIIAKIVNKFNIEDNNKSAS